MTVVTTIIAPPVLVQSFKSPKSGLRKEEEVTGIPPMEKTFTIPNLDYALRELVIADLVSTFEKEGYSVKLVSMKEQVYQIGKHPIAVEMDADPDSVHVHTRPQFQKEVEPIVQAALRGLRNRAGAIRLKAEPTIRRKKKD
jgi:hypothetical protein